jgi:hypothetical protein
MHCPQCSALLLQYFEPIGFPVHHKSARMNCSNAQNSGTSKGTAAMPRIHLGWLATTTIAVAVGLFADSAHAQVVQLPTFRFFGLSTTVSVPDRGSAYLGGVSRSAMSRSERGVPIVGHVPFAGRAFGNRAIAGRTETSGARVSAYIHDFEAMEEELLGQAGTVARRTQGARQPGAANANIARAAEPLSRPLPRALKSDAAGRASVADLRRQQALQQHAEEAVAGQAARQDFQRATQLLAAGRPGAAKVYLQRASKQADPELRAEISAIYHSLSAPTGQSQVHSAQPNSLVSRAR